MIISESASYPEGKTLDFGQLSLEKLSDNRPILLVRNQRTGVIYFNGFISSTSTCLLDQNGSVKVTVTLMPNKST
jgi:hypothetical protein